ncbi:MAG: precorrin-3B synthase [Paracoccaceae bacterium]
MTTVPKVYGWCPGALRPMMSGDGLVVRIRAPLGRLTQEQALGIADLSERCGNGLLDLSARANLQLRGVREDAHDTLLTGLRLLDLLDDDEAAEARRNVTVQPFWMQGDDTHRIAQSLSQALTDASDLNLPGKFGFAVDCGPEPVLQSTSADIRIERSGDTLILRADGADFGLPVTAETAATKAIALAHWFIETGGVADGRGRMKAHIARNGPLETHSLPVAKHSYAAQPGPTQTGTLAALEFGQIDADSFATLAQNAPIRLTPWRMLMLEGVTKPFTCTGAIFDASDPRLNVTACTGAPGCPQALSTTRQLALDLARTLPTDTKLHVSGCAKGCAHPAPADLTLTATAKDTFNLIRHGTAADQPARSNLNAFALRQTPALLTRET